MDSLLVRSSGPGSSPDLAGDIVMCYWARHVFSSFPSVSNTPSRLMLNVEKWV